MVLGALRVVAIALLAVPLLLVVTITIISGGGHG